MMSVFKHCANPSWYAEKPYAAIKRGICVIKEQFGEYRFEPNPRDLLIQTLFCLSQEESGLETCVFTCKKEGKRLSKGFIVRIYNKQYALG